MGLAICALSFIACFAATCRSVSAGVVSTMIVGYVYGILRGNIQEAASHFIYDAGAIGMYLALLMRPLPPWMKWRLRPFIPWLLCLIGWPTLLFLVPTQDFLVQLAGLRGNIFFLPFLLVGAMIGTRECNQLARALAVLNAVAFAFALAEAILGVQHFYATLDPVNVTIFRSNDVVYGGHSHYRIPATFVSSAAYAGNMVASLPFLIGAFVQQRRQRRWRYALAAAIGFAVCGIFLSGSRSAVVLLLLIALLGAYPRNKPNVPSAWWITPILIVVAIAAVTPQMQRFITLQDADYVARRVHGSVNGNFITLAVEYPMGNGLGGGGTSLPYFLQDRLTNRVVLENEYARIIAEQGIPGFFLWAAFILWLTIKAPAYRSTQWSEGKSLARLFCLFSFATAPLGLGLLDAIPGTEMLLIMAGWFASAEPPMRTAPEVARSTSLRAAKMVSFG